MAKKLFFSLGSVTLIAILLASCVKNIPQNNCSQDELVATVTPFASGLNNPRGLTFGPDGNLYVAEGGIGGTNSTDGQCDQVIPPVGPYTGSSDGARIMKVNRNGELVTVAEKLPSSQTAPTQGSLVSGVADVAFIGTTLYGVLSGAGCSHGVASTPNGIVKVHHDKTWELIVHPEDSKILNQIWSNSKKTGTTYKAEARLKGRDGEFRWFHVHGEPILSEKKEII